MRALLAELRTDAPILDERSAARRTLRLEVQAGVEESARALIHNLSERGLLIETSVELQVGESLQVDLPRIGITTALVVWIRGRFAGCEFVYPVSTAAVSAALLVAPHRHVDTRETRLQPIQPMSEHRESLDQLPNANQMWVMISLMVSTVVALALVAALLSAPFSL